MADSSGTELSEEKEAETELKKRQKRPWDDLHKSAKIGLTAELPETLGFYDISAVRREQRDHSAGKRVPLRTLLTLQLINDSWTSFMYYFSLLTVFASSITVMTQ